MSGHAPKIQKKVMEVEMTNIGVKVKPSHTFTYMVKIIGVRALDTGDGQDLYRVCVWPEHGELPPQVTAWVGTEVGHPGVPITFEQTLTFKHQSPLSKFILRLE